MKKDAYYFSHDYNAANDVKCLFLRQQLGMEGYGIFWYLVESLATAGGVLPLKIVPVLAMQMQVTETKVIGVIQNFDLFTINEEQFFSNRLNEHLDLRKTLSDEGRKGALVRWQNRGANGDANGGAIPPANGDANAKERKEKERKEIQALFEVFWDKYNLKKAKVKAERAFFNLTKVERTAAIDYIPTYLISLRDVKFQKHPTTYLHDKTWQDEAPMVETRVIMEVDPDEYLNRPVIKSAYE